MSFNLAIAEKKSYTTRKDQNKSIILIPLSNISFLKNYLDNAYLPLSMHVLAQVVVILQCANFTYMQKCFGRQSKPVFISIKMK